MGRCWADVLLACVDGLDYLLFWEVAFEAFIAGFEVVDLALGKSLR